MNDSPIGLTAARLLEAADVLLEGPEDLESLSQELGVLASALDVAGQACERSATRVVPHAMNESICARYKQAAARFAAPDQPSYERLAGAFAAVHLAAATARLAARRCREARDALPIPLGPGTRRP